MKALVVGAGLAGLTAAIDLVDAGWQVTLVERRPFAGGRTFSFTTEAGDQLDNGQHVFLGCCTAYLELLRKLGQMGHVFLQPRLDLRMLDAQGGPARLRAAPLPAPLHLLPSFLRFPYLSLPEKLSAIKALLLIRLRGLPEHESFTAWLKRQGQTRNAIRRFWDLIVIPTCNAPSDAVSASQAGFVFREGLLRTAYGANLGYARTGLSQLVPDAAVPYLRARGADLCFGATVSSLSHGRRADEAKGPCVTEAVTSQGRRLQADAYILAVPSPEAARLLPGAAEGASLDYAPIVGINLWYDRPVFEGEVLALLIDGEAFWLFDRTRILGLAGSEHHIAVSISAAGAVMDVPREELAARMSAKLARALPEAGAATLLRSHVEKVRAATFVPAPCTSNSRLPARTAVENVFLAGPWTATGWPDTMEGAVRSGHAAARLARDLV